MKAKKITLLFLFICAVLSVNAQNKIPAVNVKTIDGATFNTANMVNDGKPIIIDFWATWCKPCVQELTAIADLYEDWQKVTGVKIYAVSIDDARNSARVKPFVNTRGWEYEILLDPNADLKRALNVGDIPHTFLINGKGEIIYQHAGYAPGDENELYEKLLGCINPDVK